MYFESKIKGRAGLSWFDSRSETEKASDEYFRKLAKLAEQIDEVETNTTFLTETDPEEFDSSYQYILYRLRELRKFLTYETSILNKDWLIDWLKDIYQELTDLENESLLYDGAFDDDLEDDEDFDDETDSDEMFDSDIDDDWDDDDDDDWDDDDDDW